MQHRCNMHICKLHICMWYTFMAKSILCSYAAQMQHAHMQKRSVQHTCSEYICIVHILCIYAPCTYAALIVKRMQQVCCIYIFTPHAQREQGKVIGCGVHNYVCGRKKNLNRALKIDSPFQKFAVGLLVEFID